jgi:CBS domain-containing protein
MLANDAEAEIAFTPDPLVLPPGTTVMLAARQMESCHVSAVLVGKGKGAAHLVGIFTGRDAVIRVLAKGGDPTRMTLAEVMSYPPVIVTPSHTAIEALRLMQDTHCRHLPIVDEGKIVGLISRGDFRGADR